MHEDQGRTHLQPCGPEVEPEKSTMSPVSPCHTPSSKPKPFAFLGSVKENQGKLGKGW